MDYSDYTTNEILGEICNVVLAANSVLFVILGVAAGVYLLSVRKGA